MKLRLVTQKCLKKKKNYVVNVMMPGRVAHEHVAVVAVIGHHRLDRIQPSVPFYPRKYKKKTFLFKNGS